MCSFKQIFLASLAHYGIVKKKRNLPLENWIFNSNVSITLIIYLFLETYIVLLVQVATSSYQICFCQQLLPNLHGPLELRYKFVYRKHPIHISKLFFHLNNVNYRSTSFISDTLEIITLPSRKKSRYVFRRASFFTRWRICTIRICTSMDSSVFKLLQRQGIDV